MPSQDRGPQSEPKQNANGLLDVYSRSERVVSNAGNRGVSRSPLGPDRMGMSEGFGVDPVIDGRGPRGLSPLHTTPEPSAIVFRLKYLHKNWRTSVQARPHH
jgi:hypothetical protein